MTERLGKGCFSSFQTSFSRFSQFWHLPFSAQISRGHQVLHPITNLNVSDHSVNTGLVKLGGSKISENIKASSSLSLLCLSYKSYFRLSSTAAPTSKRPPKC